MELNRYEKWLYIYIKGFAMGCADAVPGVSGGTIALITGIYERLIDAITSINAKSMLDLVTALPSGSDVRKILSDMDIPFLVVLGFGIITAVIFVLRLMHQLLSNFPVPTYGFFFGLIAVSAAALFRGVELSDRISKLSALSGFLLAFLISGYATTTLGHGFPVLFFSGVIAVSAMVLPGISGSLILIILGQYEFMTAALSEFIDASIALLTSGSTTASLMENAPPIVVFVSGAFVGLFTVAHSVRKALEHHRHATMAFLVSLVAGALRAPVEEVSRVLSERGMEWIAVIPEFGAAALVGGFLVFLIDYRAGLVKH